MNARTISTCAAVLVFAALGFAHPAPACASESRSAATFCTSCAATVPAEALFCTHCGRPIADLAAIYCWRCGAELPADAHFCMRCGSAACSDRLGAPGALPESLRVAALPAGAPVLAPAPASAPASAAPVLPSAALLAPPVEPRAAATPSPAPPPPPPQKRYFVQELMRARAIVQPPRLLSSPIGVILPSLTLHLSGAGAFGFSERDPSGGWLFSFGLGGVGEAMISSARILHALDMRSHALAGFRVSLPIGLLDRRLSERLALALNVAASHDIDYGSEGAVSAGDGTTVQSLNYAHRETTLGLAATWQQGRLRLHAAVHGSDLRTEDIYFYAEPDGYQSAEDQRDTYESVALGFDFAIDGRTRALAEWHTVPQISFRRADRDLFVENVSEYAAGLRFYPTPILGLDATLAVDEGAVGMGDLEIGFGAHLTLGPRAPAPPSQSP